MLANGFSSEISPKLKKINNKLHQKSILKLGINTLLSESDEEESESNSPTFRKLKSIEDKDKLGSDESFSFGNEMTEDGKSFADLIKESVFYKDNCNSFCLSNSIASEHSTMKIESEDSMGKFFTKLLSEINDVKLVNQEMKETLLKNKNDKCNQKFAFESLIQSMLNLEAKHFKEKSELIDEMRILKEENSFLETKHKYFENRISFLEKGNLKIVRLLNEEKQKVEKYKTDNMDLNTEIEKMKTQIKLFEREEKKPEYFQLFSPRTSPSKKSSELLTPPSICKTSISTDTENLESMTIRIKSLENEELNSSKFIFAKWPKFKSMRNLESLESSGEIRLKALLGSQEVTKEHQSHSFNQKSCLNLSDEFMNQEKRFSVRTTRPDAYQTNQMQRSFESRMSIPSEQSLKILGKIEKMRKDLKLETGQMIKE